MSKFLKNLEGAKSLTAHDIDKIAEELHSPTTEKDKKRAVEAYETPSLHRLTIDLPEDLFEEMKRDTKKRGKTIKAFVVSLIEAHYGR
jgi:hypothetical protein